MIILLMLGPVARAQIGRGADGDPNPSSPASLCVDAIRAAELRHRLPPGLLFAIGQVESGRPQPGTNLIEPWPWTVQAQGKSVYFTDKAQAVQWVEDAMSHGVASIDTGCLQVNLYAHPHAFGAIADAFDPSENVNYAARFLEQLHATTGDWRKATGLYHSQTLASAAPYEARVERTLGGALSGGSLPSRPVSLLTQLAEAWRLTRVPRASAPVASTGNDWNSLALPTHRALATRTPPFVDRLHRPSQLSSIP